MLVFSSEDNFLLRDAYMRSAFLLSKDGWLEWCASHAGIVSKRLKISSNFFLGLVALPLWFSNTALWLRNSNGKRSLSLGWTFLKFLVSWRWAMAVLYVSAACRYVNTPYTHTIGCYGGQPCRYFPPSGWIGSRRFLNISWTSCNYIIQL